MGPSLSLWTFAVASSAQDWPAYHGSYANTKYSRLRQIDTTNVQRLHLAWRYDTGDSGKDREMQCNPLIIRGVLYGTTPKLRVFALDAATGKQLWRFDPHDGKEPTSRFRNRGLNYWESGNDRRLYFAGARGSTPSTRRPASPWPRSAQTAASTSAMTWVATPPTTRSRSPRRVSSSRTC